MSIPKQAFFYWGSGTAFPYLRYLTISSFRIKHPSWPIYIYTCKSENNEQWGGVFQDFQFNPSELHGIIARVNGTPDVKRENAIIDIPAASIAMAQKILLGDDAAPSDRIVHDKRAIERAFRNYWSDEEGLKKELLRIEESRKARESRRKEKHDWLADAVERLGAKICTYRPADARVYQMPPTSVSDIFSMEIMISEGGWYFDCDQLILKGFDGMSDCYDFVMGGQMILYIGVFGSKKGGVVAQDFYGRMIDGFDKAHYNSTGITPLQLQCICNRDWMQWFKDMAPHPSNKGTDKWRRHGEINHIVEQDKFYPICAGNSDSFWNGSFDISKTGAMAVHYFGGSTKAQQYFKTINPGNVLTEESGALKQWAIANSGRRRELAL